MRTRECDIAHAPGESRRRAARRPQNCPRLASRPSAAGAELISERLGKRSRSLVSPILKDACSRGPGRKPAPLANRPKREKVQNIIARDLPPGLKDARLKTSDDLSWSIT